MEINAGKFLRVVVHVPVVVVAMMPSVLVFFFFFFAPPEWWTLSRRRVCRERRVFVYVRVVCARHDGLYADVVCIRDVRLTAEKMDHIYSVHKGYCWTR